MPLRGLCSPVRLAAAVLGAAVLAYATSVLPARYPVPLEEPATRALTGLVAGAGGALLGYTLRSPLIAAATASTALQYSWGSHGSLSGLLVAAASWALLALVASLSGGPLEPFRPRIPPRPEALALAATSTAAAMWAGAPCSFLWAAGSLAAGALAALTEGAASLVAALLAGLGWPGVLAGAVLAALAPRGAPRCGGLEAPVAGVFGRAPASRLLLGGGRWWGVGFECSSGVGTVAVEGEGSVVVVYGPAARRAAASIAAFASPEGWAVLCASCDSSLWRSRGLSEEAYLPPDGGGAALAPGRILSIRAPRPWDYILGAASTAPQRLGAVVVDRADLVEWRILAASVEELLERAGLVILVYPDPQRRPGRLPVKAPITLVLAGPVPASALYSLLPLPGERGVEAVYLALERGYLVAYPSCGGSIVAFEETALARPTGGTL